MDLNKCVVYDVEVLRTPDEVDGGWDNPKAMGFASGVAYSYEKDQYFFFLHEEGREKLIKLLDRNIAISFNGIKFDSCVLLGNNRRHDESGTTWRLDTATEPYVCWQNIDLLLEYIKARFQYETVVEAEVKLGDKTIHDGSFGLDGLAQGTLGLNKTGHGALAPLLYKDCKYEELLEYNLQDVRLTKKLFDFVRLYGYLVDRTGKAVKIPDIL